ncbi:unnamed protein product (mitochondrion) [Plasmodiophora brassicae]|uniref:Ras-GAP domain-containing protein n=1 Tax=Plasmodiophora brassicae TaxID=37360 RepID=A0A3P3Y433_PLABS|nr:unnamed protein product [Plasmodiophora brassicae]
MRYAWCDHWAHHKIEAMPIELAKTLRTLASSAIRQERAIAADLEVRATLKSSIIIETKKNAALEQELRTIDDQIKVLLNSRASGQNLKRIEPKCQQIPDDVQHVDTEMSADVAEALHSFGAFLYVLRKEPDYLARLVRTASSKEVTSVVPLIVSTLFANPYDAQEECLLLRVIQRVLELDVNDCSDISTFLRDNSASAKLLSGYTRRDPCRAVLAEALSKPQRALLQCTDVDFELDPSKIEGTHSISVEDRLAKLTSTVDAFLQPFLGSEMPEGLCVLARILRDLSMNHFGVDATQAYRIVGGLLFLRFLNPSVVDPSLSEPNPGPLPPRTRRNLIMVAKVLQNLSNGVLFGEKEAYMIRLNDYLRDRLPSVVEFFDRITGIAELSDVVSDEESLEAQLSWRGESSLLSSSVVYITMKELSFLYEVVKEHLDVIAPADGDPLRGRLSALDPEILRNGTLPNQMLKLRVIMPDGYFRSRTMSKLNTAAQERSRSSEMSSLFKAVFELESMELNDGGENARESLVSQCVSLFTQAREICRSEGNPLLAERFSVMIANAEDVQTRDIEDAIAELHSLTSSRLAVQKRLERDIAHLQDGLGLVQGKRAHLQASINTFMQYLTNVDVSKAFRRDLSSWNLSDLVGAHMRRHSLWSNILSETGLVGSLLTRLMRIAGDSLRHERAHPSSYETTLKLIAEVSGPCAVDVVHAIVCAVMDRSRPLQSSSSCFTLGRFLVMVSSSPTASFDLLQLHFDSMALDVLLTVIPHASVSNTVTQHLTGMAFRHWLSASPSQSPGRQTHMDINHKWSSVLEQVRGAAAIAVDHSLGCVQIPEPVVEGLSRLRFNMTNGQDVTALSQLFRSLLGLLQSQQSMTSPLLIALQQCVSRLDFSAFQNIQGVAVRGHSLTAELHQLFFVDIIALYAAVLVLPVDASSVDRNRALLVATTILCRSPVDFFERHVDALVKDHLLNGLFKDRSTSSGRLDCIAQLLGGMTLKDPHERVCAVRPRIIRMIANELVGAYIRPRHFASCIKSASAVIALMATHEFTITAQTVLTPLLSRDVPQSLASSLPHHLLVGIEAAAHITNSDRQFACLVARVRRPSDAKPLSDRVSVLSSTLSRHIVDVISVCEREVGPDVQGMLLSVWPTESDNKNFGEHAGSDVNESDDRQQFYIRLYSACVGLCPDIMPETLLAATPPNVRISGGRCLVRLLLHDQEVIRRSVRSALSNTVERYPIERAQVFEGLATLMVTEMKALTTLRLTVLLEFATQLMDRIPQFFSQDVPQPDPSSWQSRFDAVAVMALTRHDVRLRTAARNILQRSASPTLRNLLHEFNLDGDRYQGVARFATLCCEDLELYDGMIVHLRRLLSVMLSAGRAEPWIEACRPNLGALLLAIAGGVHAPVVRGTRRSSSPGPNFLRLAMANDAPVSCYEALSHTHWQSVGSAVRTILSDEPVRPQHISLLQHLSRAHDFDQGLLADPDAFVRLTQLVSTQIETSTAGRPLVNLIERFSAALDHIVSSGTVSKHYDRFVDNSGHLRLFTKQVRNRALQFIKQAGAPLRDTVAAVTALVKLGPCLTTTTMTNDDSTLNWLFSCASSEASGTLLNDILRFHFGGLLPAFIARESSPLVASALASALPYQPSMLVHRHMTSIIVVALKALLSENSSVTSSARSILSCVVITPQQQLWKDVHFLLNAPTYYHRCDGARLVTRYVAEHLPVDTSLLVATKLLLSHDYDEIVLAMAPRLKLDQAQPDNVKAFLFALTSGHVHLSAIWNLFASHPDNVGIIVKHAAAGDCGGDAVIAIASVPSARVKVVDLLLSPLYEDLRQGSPGREESDHLVESLSSPVPASQRPFVPISLVRSLLHSSNWSELRHHFGAIAAWALLNGGSEADLVVSLIAARLSNATNSGKQSLPDEVMREVGTWCITGLSGAIRCRDSARMTTCLTLYCRLPSPPAAMLHLLCCLQLELDALDRLQWYAASAPPDGALNVMNALIGCAHSSTSADDLRIMFAAACSVLHCNSSPLCCSALRLAQICLRSGFLSDLHCVSDLVRDFTGIQPLLIQGAFDSECEASVRELLLTLGDHKVPQRIADSTSWRHLTTTMCFLPWLCLGAGDKDRRKEPGRLTALSHLTRILSEPAPHLSHVFAEHLSEVQSDGADVDVQAERLLHESCRRLVEAFFPEFTSACAALLHSILEREHCRYQPMALRICAAILRQPSARSVVGDFQGIIAFAKVLLSNEDAATTDDMLVSACNLVASAVRLFTDQPNTAIQEPGDGIPSSVPSHSMAAARSCLHHLIHSLSSATSTTTSTI